VRRIDESVEGPALAGPRPVLAGGPALVGLRAGFSRFGLFQDPNFWYSPAISGVQVGFSRFGMLFKKFVILGRNLEGKMSIPREIRGIGARKFVAI
jgi:hypothetical protein